jgi:hypothetical protein
VPFRTTDIGSTSSSVWSKATDVNLGVLKKRHGGILPITEQEYQRIMFHYAGVGTDPDLAIEATVSSRCTAGKATLVASVRNTDSRTANVTITTEYGEKTFTGVPPGKTVSQAFSTRLASIDAGFVGVAAMASGASFDGSTSYGARSCG